MRRGYRLAVICVVLGALVLGTHVSATTWTALTRTCPLDGTEVIGWVPGSIYMPGMSPDMCPLGVGVDGFLSAYIQCPKCGFSASCQEFDDTEGLDKERVLQALKGVSSPGLFSMWDCAIAVEQNCRNRAEVLAHLSLGAKWLADDTGEPDIIRERTEQAVAAHKRALDKGGTAPDQTQMYTYLVGELLRQLGKGEQAVEWFDRAVEMGKGETRSMALQQRLLAVYHDRPRSELLAELADAAPAEKVKAIEMLRDMDDPDVIVFLKDVVLNCPDDFREQAIYSLLGQEPHPYHLPIYLEALLSDHFRTVQGGARAVQMLRAKEGAPLIVEALRKAVPATDHRLLMALPLVATENEVEGISELVGRLTPDDNLATRIGLLRSLLNTRSDEAIPAILRVLRTVEVRDAEYILSSTELLGAAAVFGPELLVRLTEASDEGLRPALQGVRRAAEEILARVPEGTEYVQPDGEMAYRSGYVDHALGFPGGEVKSYDAVMAEIAADERRATEERDRLTAELAALPKDERGGSRTSDRLFGLRAEHHKARHLAELGRSRDPRAKPILLGYLTHTSARAQAEAVKGLMYLYDEEVGEALAGMIAEEGPLVRRVIVYVWGEASDAARADDLIAVASRPTLVETKLCWIGTMQKIDAARAVPILEYWATSPNKMLAEAAAQALGG